MIDIVERLHFDAVRSELQFSKGVAQNIEEAANEIERLRASRHIISEQLADALEVIKHIAEAPDEENEWDGTEKFRKVRETCRLFVAHVSGPSTKASNE